MFHICLDVKPDISTKDLQIPAKEYVCDICEKVIDGSRYHCNVCQDYDECEVCNSSTTHPKDHKFDHIGKEAMDLLAFLGGAAQSAVVLKDRDKIRNEEEEKEEEQVVLGGAASFKNPFFDKE